MIISFIKDFNIIIALLLINTVLIPFIGCNTVNNHSKFVKNGVEYCVDKGIFRGQWHDYYERGLSCIEGGFYEEAIKNFDMAISKQPDRVEDQRMARKYGTRFIDYFPHREKGIASFFIGKYNEAELELYRSIFHEPSEKAYTFLDKIRKQIMEQKGFDCKLPELICNINGKKVENNFVTNANILKIHGTAKSENYISEIMINNETVFIETSAKNIDFVKELFLPDGKHIIKIAATSLSGKKKYKTVTVNIDRAGPLIVFTHQDNKKNIIKGYIKDESGVLSLTMNEEIVPITSDGKKSCFTIKPGNNFKTFILMAKDKLGNETFASLNSKIYCTDLDKIYLAENNSQLFTDAIYYVKNNVNNEPEIHLYGWKKNNIVYSEMVNIEGQLLSDYSSTSLYINGNKILENSGKVNFFCRPVPLKTGENNINIRAANNNNYINTKNIIINRKIPDILKDKYKYPLYISLFKFHDKEKNEIADQFRILLIEKFSKRKRFRLLNSTKEVNAIIEGYVYKTRLGIEIIARFVDASTRKIICIKDAFSEQESSSINELASRLSQKIHNEFQTINGIVINVNKNDCLIIPEITGKVKINWPVLLYRQENEIRNPITGKYYGRNYNVFGYAYINEIKAKSYSAYYYEKLDIKLYDFARTK